MKLVAPLGLVLALVTGCMSPVMTFGEGKSAKEAQRHTMSELGPARLVTDATWHGEVATRKIRVWADGEFRAQNVRWQKTFEGALELANLVSSRTFGLRLEPEYHGWERHAPGGTLAECLAALMAHDPGGDVFAVVGLTSALPLVSSTFDELGYATVGGRHLVVRGYADLEERELYEHVFRDLTAEERELALDARRQHKTAVVLLHELGHNLGADHDTDEETIMSAGYSQRANAFSAAAREVILRTLDARLGRGAAGSDPAPTTTTERGHSTGPVVLHVTAAGEILLGDAVLGGGELDDLLVGAFARDPATEIVIKRARKAPSSALAPIVERASRIGLTRISVSLY